ncbi:helix-turn-helix transcriptional regulator [Oerskovia enterophila]|uniref:HTH-type transcriptional regulator MalT n=2 Tax=Oerskovia enterophila TaxID=43678 RepID=A0A163QN27_9CELL|nr:LuxR family transcriptional regulator [Oerskovia enterophila]KZM34344.1 HTH-type transcriptional regulator MalT [Oerskovia enterophila]
MVAHSVATVQDTRQDSGSGHGVGAAVPPRSMAEQAFAAGDAHAAIRCAIRAGDVDFASRVAVKYWYILCATDVEGTIVVLEELDHRQLREHPYLAIILALAYNTTTTRRVRAVELFGTAVAALALRYPGSGVGERLILSTLESVAFRVMGQGTAARAAAKRARELLATVRAGDSEMIDLLRFDLAQQVGTSFFVGGDLVEAKATLNDVLAAQGRAGGARLTLGLLAGLHATNGEMLSSARHVAAEQERSWPPIVHGPYIDALFHSSRAWDAVERFDLAAAQTVLDDVAEELRTNELWPLFALAQVYVDLGSGTPALGESRLAQTIARGERAPTTAYWRSRLAVARSTLALAAGQGERALSAVRKLSRDDLDVRVAVARAALAQHDHDGALMILAGTQGVAVAGARHRAERLLLLAAAAARSDLGAMAVATAQDAAITLRTSGTRLPLMLVHRDDRLAVAELLRSAGDLQSAELIHGDQHVPDVLPNVVRVVDLSERELVVLQGLVAGADLPLLASRLFVSPNTIKTQIKSIYRKLEVRTKRDAVIAALHKGLV